MPSATDATPRPRRRKIPKTSEKENARATTRDSNADISKSRSRKNHRDEFALKEDDDNMAIDLSLNEDSALAKFQDAAGSASYWKRHASLAESAVRASQSLCQKTTSSLLLEENVSDLLSTCRTHVKDATEQKDSTERLKLLYIAIHGLRALCPILTDTKKVEATMRILYHAVTTASDVCVKSKDLTVCMDAMSQCLASFQALGSLLNGYKVETEDNKSVITFKWKTLKTPSDLFPLPALSSSGKASGGAMTVKQVFKIAMQASLSVANALAHVYTIQIRKGGTTISRVNDFGPYTFEIMQQTASYESVVRVAQEVTIPWTCLLSSNELSTKENIADSLACAKRVFRLLFDVASQIDKCVSQASSREDTPSPADSLLLRKQAILAYLLSSKDVKLSQKAQSAVREHHWEAACTYACKASVAYRQQLAIKDKREVHDECLDRFHKDVGRVLDSFATTYSLSYIEYTAYRALHATSRKTAPHDPCQSKDCVFGLLGFRFQHKECTSAHDPSEAAGRATLAVFFLALRMQSELDVLMNGKRPRDQQQSKWTTDLEDACDDIIASFRSVFVEAASLPPHDVTNRCHKLLEALGLNRKVYQILSAKDTQQCSRATLTALELSGRVLSECMGPLGVLLIRSGEAKKQQQQWELAVDSFVRGIAVFERVREQQIRTQEIVCSDLHCRTDDALRGLFTLCHDKELAAQLSEDTLEKAAKTIFSIGRVRRERKEYDEALLPLCLGNDLFSKLADIRGPVAVNESQLPMRYSHLASTFSSLDMTEAACLALVLAVVYDVVASVVVAADAEGEDDPIHLLRQLSALTNGVVLMEQSTESRSFRCSLVSRLVRVSKILTQQSWSMPTRSTGEDFVVFTTRLLRSSAGLADELGIEPSSDSDKPTRFSLATLLSFAFKDNKLFRNVKRTRLDAVRTEQLTTMAVVVVEHGAMLQRDDSVDQSDSRLASIQMKDFNRSFQFLEWLAKATVQDEDASHAILALVHILAAESLVPSSAREWPQVSKRKADNRVLEQKDDDVLLLHGRKLISRATEILRGALDKMQNEEQRLSSGVLLLCAALYSSEISGADPAIVSATTKNEILSTGQEAVQQLVETSSISNETRHSFGVSLTRTLTRFQDMVNLEGDKLSAAQAALLIARIHEGTGKVDERWYWATAGNLLLDGGLHQLAEELLETKHLRNQVALVGKSICLMDLIQFEIIATRSRMRMQSLEKVSSNPVVQEVIDLFDQCNSILVQPEMEPLIRVMLRWICGSCVMALAEGFECRGVPNRAVEYLRQGVTLCREAIAALRKLRNFSALVYNGDRSTGWADIALSTFLLRLTERRTEIQQRMSTAYAHLGDHRRSEAYAVGAAKECMLGGHDTTRQRLKIDDLASIDRSEIHAMCQSTSYRLLLEMKAKASPSDRVLESLHKTMTLDQILTIPPQVGDALDRVSWQIDNIRNLLNAGDLHYLSVNDPENRFKEFYQAADNETKALMLSPTTTSIFSSFGSQHDYTDNSHAFASLLSELQLRRARVLLSEPSDRNERTARDLLTEIIEMPSASASCRAWAHYYLGLLNIKVARQMGALQALWKDHEAHAYDRSADGPAYDSRDGRHAIATARSHLREALVLVGPASDALSRDAMRSLALLAGPSKREDSVEATALIHSSIGATTRHVLTSALVTNELPKNDCNASQSDVNHDEKLCHLFESLDAPWSDLPERHRRISFLFGEAGKSLPSSCRVVAIALCPTGEILVTSMWPSVEQPSGLEVDTACIFPDTDQDSILDTTVYDDVMKPLDELIQLNENQIRGLDTTTVEDNFKEESSKRDWWNDRQRADDQLQALVEDAESKYFSSECVKRMFTGSDDEDDFSVSCGNLASKFEEACSVGETSEENETSVDEEDVQSMTVSELKAELEQLQIHVTTRRKPSKKQLIDMLIEARENNRHSTAVQSDRTTASEENCMLLVLDENLHRFPFEGMELCSKWAVSRVPSLPFAIAPLVESRSDDDDSRDKYPEVNPIDASYIVDPEGNLSQTKNRLVPAISDICESNDWDWRSVVGSIPSEDFVQHALTRRDGLLLYCGHGGATCCFSRSRVEALMKDDGNEGTRRCRSTIILMGCSSGKLVSVNRKDSKITEKVTMFYEPEGIALSYLCAGAPCVVGNLWDVTDRDIDRYCITLLERFLGSNNEGQSLAKCVAEARSSCKMRHIVGLAPVCYGVPVHLLK